MLHIATTWTPCNIATTRSPTPTAGVQGHLHDLLRTDRANQRPGWPRHVVTSPSRRPNCLNSAIPTLHSLCVTRTGRDHKSRNLEAGLLPKATDRPTCFPLQRHRLLHQSHFMPVGRLQQSAAPTSWRRNSLTIWTTLSRRRWNILMCTFWDFISGFLDLLMWSWFSIQSIIWEKVSINSSSCKIFTTFAHTYFVC